jgi:hypothetical protein
MTAQTPAKILSAAVQATADSILAGVWAVANFAENVKFFS